MAELERAASVVSDWIASQMSSFPDEVDNWSDMLVLFGTSSEKFKEEVETVLCQYGDVNPDSVFDLDDGCRIREKDGTVHKYRKLTDEVRKLLFR